MKHIDKPHDRRTLLSMIIIAVSVGLAGCTGPGESEDSGDDGDTGGDSDESEDGDEDGGGGGGGYNNKINEQPTMHTK